MATRLFFSNDIETLADAFAESVVRRRDWTDPPTIIVPNPYLEKWLQLKIAGTYGIAMNLNFQFLNDGLWGIVNRLVGGAETPAMIEHPDLQLLIYLSIMDLDTANARIKPLTAYLLEADGGRGADYEKKAWQLSSRQARYFLEYELYREEMIKDWIEGRQVYPNDMEAAQQYLYHAVFKKKGYRDTLYKNSRTLPQRWNSSSSRISGSFPHELYLFGKSQISPFHIRMIYELGGHIDISIYQMNPCSEFWEDVTTPGEDRWERIRSIAVREDREGHVLADNEFENPLLKLWGKTGRENVKLLSQLEEAGSADLSFVTQWIVPKNSRPAGSCLGTVQAQILKRTTRTGSSNGIAQDTSIQIASCPDIFREVEATYNSILHNLESDGSLKMTDIAVLVPEMNSYGPVLDSVFSRRPKRISFSMIDSSAAMRSLFAEALHALLEIASGPFTRKTIFDLVFNRCFLEAFSMTADDALQWLAWADAMNIFRDFLTNDTADPACNPYTWQQGLQRLRLGRIMGTAELRQNTGILLDYKNIIPFTDRGTNEQYLVDSFSTVIELLYHRTHYLAALKTSGAGWAGIIQNLISNFTAIPADMGEENRVVDGLMDCMKKLSAINAPADRNGNGPFSFSFIKEFIAENLGNIPGRRGSYLTGGINISALVPKRQIPFKIIYVLGMQEGVFPGTGDSSTLNLMNIKRKIGDVGRPDINRYLFLETLLAAKEKLYLSYVSKDLQKDQDFHPNSIVGQLIAYLNNHVLAEDFKIVAVPSSGASEHYLYTAALAEYSDILSSRANGTFQVINYCETDRLLMLHKALKNNGIEPIQADLISKKFNSRSRPFVIPQKAIAAHEKMTAVSVSDLAAYLINPIESSLRRHLGIYNEDYEDGSQIEDEPFFSVYPHGYRFILDSLNYYVRSGPNIDLQRFMDEYYYQARLKSVTPHGAFAAIDLDEIKSAIAERVSAGGSLSEFLRTKIESAFYRNVTFGSAPLHDEPDMAFPPVRIAVAVHERSIAVELSGMLPFLWTDKTTGETDTLVLTNRARPAVNDVIRPFLAYVIGVSGYDKALQQYIGSGACTVHVSYKSGIASYRYLLDETASREYLGRVLSEFLNDCGFDMLPIQVISKYKRLVPPDWQDHPGAPERRDYQVTLARLINDEAEKAHPSFIPMDIIGLMDARVPPDAYDKVRDRLGLLLKPFVYGATRP